MDTCGYIYNNSFDPIFPIQNLLWSDDDGGGNWQFMFKIPLQTVAEYILVATTHYHENTGTFSIIATGPGPVTFIGG